MNLSVGVLYDSQKFIGLCASESFLLADVRTAFQRRYESVPIGAVLAMIRAGNWVKFEDDGSLSLTERGREILKCSDTVTAMRMQIMDYITFVKPAWSSLIPKGRAETLPFLPADARQCFNEAALSSGYNQQVVEFWDRAANLSRGRTDNVLLDIGRAGERLSIEYEIQRTGTAPVWKSIDSNLAGYDLLSRVSAEDERPLKIEVKATQKLDERAFYISKGEWNCAIGYGEYVVHLWILESEPRLILMNPDEVAPHVPIDQGDGSWQSVKIAVTA